MPTFRINVKVVNADVIFAEGFEPGVLAYQDYTIDDEEWDDSSDTDKAMWALRMQEGILDDVIETTIEEIDE